MKEKFLSAYLKPNLKIFLKTILRLYKSINAYFKDILKNYVKGDLKSYCEE